MNSDEMLTMAIVGGVAYALYKFGVFNKPDTEQIIGLAKANAPKGITVAESDLDKNKSIVMKSTDTQNISYKINPNDLNPFQRMAFTHGWYSIENDIFKTNIPWVPFICQAQTHQFM